MQSKLGNKWFWAVLVQMTCKKSELNNLRAEVEVWENLVILQAKNECSAVAKALKFGLVDQGDCGGTLRLDGMPAQTKFLGLEDIGLIHEDLGDGAEILWELKRCSQRAARRLVKRQSQMITNLKKELKWKNPSRKIIRAVAQFKKAHKNDLRASS